jgi:hypothetical protein
MTDEDFNILKDYIKQRYIERFGSEEGFNVPFTSYDFSKKA